jgi:glycolate oxidase FAD binding subunit
MTLNLDNRKLDVHLAASPADVGEFIQRHQGGALHPVGGRTELGLGNSPSMPGVAIDLTALNQVIDFPARDMTITVQSGIRIAQLQRLLSTENLRLPIDVPSAAQATLGGILATNTSGTRRYGYGTLRDYVIGISAMNDEGREFKAGGRVVKNVAGYDICKLMIGSLGTLGIITQVTLKLRPLVEQEELLLVQASAAYLEGILRKLLASRTRPIAIDVVDAASGSEMGLSIGGDYGVLVGYDGNREAVAWQIEQLRAELPETPPSPLPPVTWQKLADWTHQPAAAVLKASLLPSCIVEFLQAVRSLPGRARLRAHAGNGIVFGLLPEETTAGVFAETVEAWRKRAAPAQGHVIVTRCPAEWKTSVSVWGPAPKDIAVMRAVKKQFDPGNLFNPGRFVDGI